MASTLKVKHISIVFDDPKDAIKAYKALSKGVMTDIAPTALDSNEWVRFAVDSDVTLKDSAEEVLPAEAKAAIEAGTFAEWKAKKEARDKEFAELLESAGQAVKRMTGGISGIRMPGPHMTAAMADPPLTSEQHADVIEPGTYGSKAEEYAEAAARG